MKKQMNDFWPLVKKYWPVLVVALVTFLQYLHSKDFDFLRWDDRQNIQLNPWLQNQAFYLIWTRPYYNMYIPVTYSTWSILWWFSKEAWIFHWLNIIFHTLNAVLVYWLARQVLPKQDRGAAVIAALVFACHPLNVESVAWISTGRDLLAGFFSLLAINLIVRSHTPMIAVITTLLFSISLLCKPSVAVMPAAAALLLWGLGRLDRARMITLGVWMVPAIAASYATKRIQQLDADLRLKPMDLIDRIMVAFDTIAFYVQKFFAPWGLSADYGRTREVALGEDVWILGLIGVIATIALLWFLRSKLPRMLPYHVGWFLLVLTPVLGIIPFQAQATSTVSDRYAYMPLIGLGLAVGCLVADRRWAKGIASVAVAALFIVTGLRAEVWRTNEGFFTDMKEKNERSNVAYGSLGVEMILNNRLNEAEAYLNKAVQLKPTDVIPRTNLAQLYLLLNQPERVVREIVPLLEDPEFLRINQTETRALASAYRLSGRAHWMLRIWSRANLFYCRWFQLDFENEEGKTEIAKFLEDAKRSGAPPLPNCEIRLPQ